MGWGALDLLLEEMDIGVGVVRDGGWTEVALGQPTVHQGARGVGES